MMRHRNPQESTHARRHKPVWHKLIRHKLVWHCAAAALASTAALLAGGCASPGHPQPPSLWIPRLATDLTAERVGNDVQLHWNTPDRTTDGARLPAAPVLARICRGPAPANAAVPAAAPPSGTSSNATTRAARAQSGATAACAAVAQLSVRPGPSSAVDQLPGSLTTGATQLLAYRIELLGPKGRTAGPSAPAFAIAGAAPEPLASFTATDTAAGALLRWSRESAPAPGESVQVDRTTLGNPAGPSSRAPVPIPAPGDQRLNAHGTHVALPPPTSGSAVVHLTAGEGDPGGVIDRTGEIGGTYTYTAQRVRTVTAAGRTLELRGLVAGPVTVTLRDVFPPATPLGLAASPGPGSIDLSWEPVEEPLKGERLAGYRVYREPQGTTPSTWTLLTPEPVTVPAFRDLAVQPGQSYRYRVTAVDAAGNESPPSSELTQTATQTAAQP